MRRTLADARAVLTADLLAAEYTSRSFQIAAILVDGGSLLASRHGDPNSWPVPG